MKYLITLIVGYIIYKMMSKPNKIDQAKHNAIDQEPDEDYVDFEEVE